MVNYEYKTREVDTGTVKPSVAFVTALEEMDEDGWEFVHEVKDEY